MVYKVYYFDIYARAEPIRMLLTHAKVEFEDHRINGEQGYFRAQFEKDEERKKTTTAEFLAFLPGWITAIQKRIEHNVDQKYVVGTKRTTADIVLAALAFSLIFNQLQPLKLNLRKFFKFYGNEANPHYAEVAPLTKKEDYPVLATYLEGLKEEFKDYLAARPSPRPF